MLAKPRLRPRVLKLRTSAASLNFRRRRRLTTERSLS
jgi:hypothetical protein